MRKTGQILESKNSISVQIDYLPSVNYAIMNSGINVCNSLVLENCDTEDWYGLSVEISGQYIKDCGCRFELLKRRQSVQVNSIKIEPDYRILCEITEAVKTTFLLVVKSMEVILYEKEYPITLLSFEEWAGSGVLPEHIAAFVVPNNPLLSIFNPHCRCILCN